MELGELSGYLKGTYAGRHWEKLGVRRRAGILFPLFSIRTSENMGMGEYPDLNLLVDWCVLTGHSVIQLLPTNDTGVNNFPYSALSAFALNPAFLSLQKMDGAPSGASAHLENSAQTNGTRFQFLRILEKKIRLFETLFTSFQKTASSKLKAEFRDFTSKNSFWLHDYSTFMALKEIHRWRPWEEWRSKYSKRNKRAMKLFSEFHSTRVVFFFFLKNGPLLFFSKFWVNTSQLIKIKKKKKYSI
ncbi:MAG: 4-alpha-glucanotransferase [Nitrospinota bacterium]